MINFVKCNDLNDKPYFFVINPLFPFRAYFQYLNMDYDASHSRTFWDFLNNFSFRILYGNVAPLFSPQSWCVQEWSLSRVTLIESGFYPFEPYPQFKFVNYFELLGLFLQGRIVSYRNRHLLHKHLRED